jgi:hypothetical protein
MANLIKRIAISTSRRTGKADIAQEFKSSDNSSLTGKQSSHVAAKFGSVHELESIVSYSGRAASFTATGNQIKATKEVSVTSEPSSWARRGSEVEITGGFAGKASVPGVIVEEDISRTKSGASSVHMAESVQSVRGDVPKRTEDSDDEAALVEKASTPGWGKIAWQ